MVWNYKDHGGYQPHELFIEQKYEDLKSEILNNKIYSLSLASFRIALAKANMYISSAKAKTLKSDKYTYDHPLHYRIKIGRKLRVSNLLSVILYTDFSELCTEFSKTFRRLQPYEPLHSVKKRNKEYAIWSRTLRETVEGFGDPAHSKTFNYFTGLSAVMVMPEMNIRFVQSVCIFIDFILILTSSTFTFLL